ncbi:MAG: UDP-glucose 4-epimerase GalE [Brevinema sp.]
MKNILVIGGAGYIGSHTVKQLHTQGFNVIVLDNLSKGHREAIEAIDRSIPLIQGDLGDSKLLGEIFTKYSIDAVMHFAALIEVGASVFHPDVYYQNNVCKVLSLLDTMRTHHVNNFVFSSTAATFGIPQSEKVSEAHPQLPINPYGSSKLMVEWILRDYAHAFPEFNYCILRYFNACGADFDGKIGASYDPAALLITVTLQVAKGSRDCLKIFGTDYPTPDGTAIRDYIHVVDLAKAHILGMERMLKDKISDSYNLGTGRGYSVSEVISLCKKITGIDFCVEESTRREGDPPYLVADPGKAEKLLKWKAEHNLEDMIRTAWHWEQHKTY